jgi:hypothetical protein
MRTLRIAVVCVTLAFAACNRTEPPAQRTFDTPEAAVEALAEAVKKGTVDDVLAFFGPDGKTLLDSSDPVVARRNRQVFTVAVAERWQLVSEAGDRRVLVIGHEEWPFPVPLTKAAQGWHFDTAAGVEEVLARRIGRNELAVMALCRAYVRAQEIYARTGHDGNKAGLYATTFRSDTGRHNGLYWPAAHGEKRSPLGDLVARAAEAGVRAPGPGAEPSPFRGYYFRILTAQGPSAPGGAKNFLAGSGGLSGGHALVAWPAQYDVTGVMTFLVSHEGIVHEKDLGEATDRAARAMTAYDPDSSWTPAR